MTRSNTPDAEFFLVDADGEVIEINDPRHPDFEPTDDQMMAAFGTKWHDGL